MSSSRALTLFALALTLAAPAARADETPPTTASALADTTRPAVFLDQVLVTGARYPRAYYESPQALSFLTRTQLRDQMPTVLGDALWTLPGSDVSKDSPWEQRPVLRGLGGQRVLVLMDGDPVNSARGNGPHPSLVDASQVERVEVVRGPSSVAYGSDALGGVINIITRQAPLDGAGRSLRGSATYGGSTADRQSSASLQLMPQIDRFSAFLSSGGRSAGDFRTPDHGRVDASSFSDYNGIANLRYALTDHLALKGGWQLYRGHDIGLPGLAFSMPGFEQAFHFPYYRRDAVHLSAEHHNEASKLFASSGVKAYWQTEGRDFYSHMAFDNAFLGPGSPGPGTFVDDTDRYLKLHTVGVQAQFSSRRFDHGRITAGIDAARDMTDGTNVDRTVDNDPSGTPYAPAGLAVSRSLPSGRFDSYAAFSQTELFIHPRWTASLGGRYTHYRYRTDFGVAQPASSSGGPPTPEVDFVPMKTDDDALAGSAGLVFSPRSDLHLSANIANGYRHPNAQDLFFNGPASVGIVLGNSTLKPERSISGEVGLRWGPRALGLSGNLFYSTYEDLIDAIQIATGAGGAPATYQYVNITKARIYGAEAEGEWEFVPGFRARANVTTAIGDITSRDAIKTLYNLDADRVPLPNVPPLKGSAGLRWNGSGNRWWVEPAARWSWRTNRLSPDPLYSTFKKEWIVGDLMAGARIPGGEKLTLGIKNFTDRSYRLPLGSLEEPGISFVGALTADF